MTSNKSCAGMSRAEGGNAAHSCSNRLHKAVFTPARRLGMPRHRHASAALAAAASTSSAPAADAQATTAAYMQWASQTGILSPKLTQAYFGNLRGAKALEDIAPEEAFVTVPRAAALVVMPQARCPVPAVDPAAWKELPWFVKMAVLLLEEAGKGTSSAVWGYINQLPSSIDTPVRWSDEELESLQYGPAAEAIRRQRRAWEQYHLQLQGAWPACPDWERLLWALENVRSRSFSGPWTGSSIGDKARTAAVILGGGGAYALWQHLPLQQALNGVLAALIFNVVYDLLLAKKLKWYAMCPVVDAANHSSTAESEVAYEYFRDTFVLSTKAAHRAGEQVFITYGQQSNDSLLQYYGFTEAGNPHDTYRLSARLGGQTLELTFTAKGSLTADSLAAARGAQPDSAQLQRELLSALSAELASKPSSLADDERALQTPHLLGARALMATSFRVEKKRLLERCIAKAKKKAGKAKGGAQ